MNALQLHKVIVALDVKASLCCSMSLSGFLWRSLAFFGALGRSLALSGFLWLSLMSLALFAVLWTSPACSAVLVVLWTSLAVELAWAKNLKMDGCQFQVKISSFCYCKWSLLGQSPGGVFLEPGGSSSSLEVPADDLKLKTKKYIEKPKENDEFKVSWLSHGRRKC